MSASVNILPALRKKGPLAVLLAYSVFILWASLKESGDSVSIKHFDKVLHLAVYGLLAAIAYWVWPKVHKWKIWLGAALYGGLIELCQGLFTQGRTPSIADGLANAGGAAIVLLLCYYWLSPRLAKA